MALFAELRRRNVLKVALLYVVASWLIVFLVGSIQARLVMPIWTETFTYFVLAVGFPVALWFAWTYEFTAVGLKRAADVDQTQSIVYKTGQKLNAAVAVLVVLGVLAMFGQRLLPRFEFLVPGVPAGEAPASALTPKDIRSLTLDNGLKIIVWPDHDIPNVSMYTFVRAGGRNERPGITGVSHFFEHMMFLGTENLQPGDFDSIMEAEGGANNAYTSADVTVYMNWFPRSALEKIFEIEGDRFENLSIVPESFNAEREVVYSERRLRDDSNDALLSEHVQATAFVAHPYQFPVIGWPSDIESWTQDDLLTYYRTYYAPNNRTVVVTGDVTPGEVFALADEFLSGAPAQPPPPAVRTVEPPQQGVRRVALELPAQTPLLQVAFHSPGAAAPDSLALSLLVAILTDGDSARLHRSLVEEEGLASAIGGYRDEGFDPGLTWFFLTLPPGGDPAIVEQRLLEELQRIAVDGVTAEELDKARNMALADFWRGLSTINGKASALGNYEVFYGDYESLFKRPDAIGAVTADALRAVAAKTFRPANMTVGVVHESGPEDAP
jgi:zinc protease